MGPVATEPSLKNTGHISTGHKLRTECPTTYAYGRVTFTSEIFTFGNVNPVTSNHKSDEPVSKIT